MMIVIKFGRVVDPLTGTDEVLDICIEDGIITKVGNNMSIAKADGIIDASRFVVAPGLMDGHVHFRDPGFTHKEDIISGAEAAKKGGFTTVVCMANTNPPVDNVDTLDYVLNKGKSTDIHILSGATVTAGMKGEKLSDLEALADRGAVVFTDDGLPIMDEKLLYEAFEQAKKLNIPISLHEEDPRFIESPGVNRGYVAEKLGVGGASPIAEDVMVARDCALALHTGARLCIQHISSKKSVDIVRAFKKLGADIHAEATPHHFSLTEEAVLEHGSLAKMNPPVRTEEDRLAIIEGLKDGTIDMIVTDHAPHSVEEKSRTFAEAPSGIIGLETSLGLAVKNLVQPGHMPLIDVIAKMSLNPARFYGVDTWSVSEGSVADLVLFRENQMWTVDKFASKSSNSPFVGESLPAKIYFTICGGKIICDNE